MDQIIHDFPPFFRVYATGHVERYEKHDFIPPSTDPRTGVVSRDVVFSPENNLPLRIYLPEKATGAGSKLPLLIYIHGGGFSVQSAFSSLYQNFLNSLAAKSQSVVVSIEYRLAPEHPLPACYEDAFSAAKWVGQGSDPWMNEHADLNRVYILGDSAGANIAHDVASRSGGDDAVGFKLAGLILIHPFFGMGTTGELWDYICCGTIGPDDFRLNPAADPGRLSRLGCRGVLICLAESDFLRARGWNYYQALKNSEWEGDPVEIFETSGEGHVFHLRDGESENAVSLMKRICDFVNGGGL